MDRVKRGEHLIEDGLRKIVAIRAAMNWGLSEKLHSAFPDVVRVERPLHKLPQTIHPDWLTGFTDGDGCFFVHLTPSKTHLVGFKVILGFQLSQHTRDEKLFISFIAYFNCGRISKQGEVIYFMVTEFNEIQKKIIPFFQKYPLHSVKALDFKDFCRVAELIKNKKHLTAEGLEEIRNIKAGMNRGRKLD